MSGNAQDVLDPKVVLSPLLSVRNGIRAVKFYKQAFGANELFRIDDGQGSIVARLSIGTSEFWLADDPDALFAGAVRPGATVVDAISNKDYGWRGGRIVDPFGYHWEIGKPLHAI